MKLPHNIPLFEKFCKYRLTLVNFWKILNPYLGPAHPSLDKCESTYHFKLQPILNRNQSGMKLNLSNPKPIKSPRALSCVATLSDFSVLNCWTLVESYIFECTLSHIQTHCMIRIEILNKVAAPTQIVPWPHFFSEIYSLELRIRHFKCNEWKSVWVNLGQLN